jgi:DNA-binding response OmpR family regulator
MSDKILIVDDEPSNRNILGQELTHEGYSVVAASGGREALKKVESSRPDLIILDYMMPDLSGLEVLKELRKRENDTPVVMITAYGTMERAVESMKEGAYDFITRPFEPDHLALVVRKALERQRLKRGVEILSDEVQQRYRLVVGQSAAMKQAVDLAKKAASSNATVLLLVRAARAKKSSLALFTTGVKKRIGPLSLSTRWGYRKNSWRASFSATNKGRLPVRTGARRERSNWLTAARSFSTRSAMSLWNFRRSS